MGPCPHKFEISNVSIIELTQEKLPMSPYFLILWVVCPISPRQNTTKPCTEAMLEVSLFFLYRDYIIRQYLVHVMYLPVSVRIYQLALGQAGEITLKGRSKVAPAPNPPLKGNTTKHGSWSWKLYFLLRSICTFMHSMFLMCWVISLFTLSPTSLRKQKRYNFLAIKTGYCHLSCFLLFFYI